MKNFFEKVIYLSFCLLFFSLPLILYSKTSEIFEFNKMITVYFFTSVIFGLWITKMILYRKIIFKKSLLDKPLIIFLIAMSISTMFSIDPRTSMFGYYSRFNGGLMSLISYSILYWAFVSNIDKNKAIKSIFVLFASSLLSSIWAIFEHFGHSFSCLIFSDFGTFDNSCWVQDVQNRVYSSFGQPNWLAAWIVAIIPLSWVISLRPTKLPFKLNIFIFQLLSVIFLISLLYTKSRSGILAFLVSFIIFWSYYSFFYKVDKLKKKIFVTFFIILATLLTIFTIGTPWTKTFNQLISKSATPQIVDNSNSPVLETGGTESGTIRKIVWEGALEIWKAYPIFGTGLETFAYSYYKFKPIEHNLTSEWDFLYNKAHNEYLNFLSTTGIIGTLAYLAVIMTSLIQIFRVSKKKLLVIGLISGYITILITNFFGFSTVAINTLFFLFPALAVASQMSSKVDINTNYNLQLNTVQKFAIFATVISTLGLINSIYNYWFSDLTYAKGKIYNDSGSYLNATKVLESLVEKSPNEPNYWDELSNSHANLAIYYAENSQENEASFFAQKSYVELKNAIHLSPSNVAIKRKSAVRLISLTAIDTNYLLLAKNILEDTVVLAPTDAKLHYNLALTFLRSNEYDKALETIKKTIVLKPDYELARYALALMYIDLGEKDLAIKELNYILEKINPENITVQRELNELQ